MKLSKQILIRTAGAVLVAAAIYVPVNRYVLSKNETAPSGQSGPSSPQDVAKSKEHEAKVLQAQLEKKPGHAPVLLRMAELAREAGKTEEVVKHLREAVQNEPGNIEARLELGRALYDLGDAQAAIQETSTILKTNPKDTDALYNIGAIYANTGDFANAVKFWQDAIQAGAETESGKRAKDSLAQLAKTPQVSGPNPHGGGLPGGHPPVGDSSGEVGDFIRSVATRR